MNILLLEDNSIDADLTKRSLSSSIPDCKVDTVTTLKQAKLLFQNPVDYDIAFLDMNLPDGNGLELLMEIRRLGLKLAVVILTGSGNEEVAVAALKAGADDYVVKSDDYISKLPQIIDFALKSFNENFKQRSENINVLYIEYHILDIDLTIRHLRNYAPYIHLDISPNAETAIEQIIRNENGPNPYQVILIDYRLPGMNALEFIKKIRQEYKIGIPIILVTGQGNEQVAIEALKLGANDYLTKSDNYYFRLPSLITSVYQYGELVKKQAAIIESESKYRLLADNSGDVIFVLDMDFNYTYISPSVKTLRGYDPDVAIKQKLDEVLTPDSFKKVTSVISRFISEHSNSNGISVIPHILELEMNRKDKTTVWTEVKASLIVDEQNNKIGILGTTRDISERKLAVDELRKRSWAVEQSPTSIIITDPKGNIEYTNPKFTELTGYTLEEVKDKNPSILSSGHTTKEQYAILWNTILSGGEWKGEFYNKRKDGSLFWESASISPITDNDGQITHFLAIKEDITGLKKNIQELIIAKEKAEESERLKSAFLSNISHEIRTPMNGILGFAEILREPDLTGDERNKFINIIEKSGIRMLNIINEIVDISKIESGQIDLDIKETNINDQIEYIYSLFQSEAELKKIQLLAKTPLTTDKAIINTDKEKFRTILMNLVNNAIKYTDNGSVEFGYTVNSSESSKVFEFFVKDTGIGIPRDRHDAVFERFIQADISDKMARQGAGLGLTISKSFVESLKGKIWMESIEGRGSEFHFTLQQ